MRDKQVSMPEMNNLERESLFLKILSEDGLVREGYIHYQIRRQFGKGYILLYPLFPGFYLSINNFQLKNPILKNYHHSTFSNSLLKFDYCLKGEYKFSSPEEKIGIVSQGDCGCYAGQNSFKKVEFKDGKCCSISLFCYLDKFKTALKQSWGDSGIRLDEYYRKILDREEFLITKNDPLCGQFLKEIQKIVAKGDPIPLRLRTIELFFREVDLFLKNKKKDKRFYSRIQLDKVARIKKNIDENYNKNFTVEDLSLKEGINTSYLKSIFKDKYGDSIYSYKKTLRLKKAEILLRETDLHIYEIVQAVGYTDAGKFTKAFRERYKFPPGAYRALIRK